MKSLFIPYELALKEKEKGFDEPCLAMYTDRYFSGLDMPMAIDQHEGSGISGDRNSDFKSPHYKYTTAPRYK